MVISNIPTSIPTGAEAITSSTAGSLHSLQSSISGTGGAMEASNLLGSVASPIMGTIVSVGALALTVLGVATMVGEGPIAKKIDSMI